MERLERIKELLAKRQEIDRELVEIKEQARKERAAFVAARKPRQPRKLKENANA
jgi:hypothetical protein